MSTEDGAVTDVDRITLLRLARDTLVTKIEAGEDDTMCRKCGGPIATSLPALVRELRATLVEIDAMPGAGEVTDLDRLAGRVADDLADRRARRLADTPAS